MSNIAVIGYGSQVKRLIGILLEQDTESRIAAIADPRHEAIKRDMQAEGVETSGIRFFESADDMLDSGKYDGVMIGTRCSLHTPMAIKALNRGLPLYLEKPVSTTMSDLISLRGAYRSSSSPVVVSFPLRVTHHVRLVKEIVDSGRIGTVEHVQAVNNVAYGSVYFHNWYRNEEETQGLFLQKATHDFDYINHVLGIRPVRVCAMTSKQIFKGDKPAGLTCGVCEEREVCPESPQNLRKAGEQPFGDSCSFAEDTGNEDSGSALVQYESGMHASYSQNFFVKKKAAYRGARFMGYKGTVEFDWISDQVRVFMHHTPRVETYQIDSSATAVGHGGGDHMLMDNFARLMKDRGARSISPLDAGLESALLCLKAKASALTGCFQNIAWPDEEAEADRNGR
ncbi:Gfo/Idh/MocA family protein [Paenibacillus contaminans]|uniref:Gfo/Idh/MocA family oxidoreductase n=1 Tax=Paenibacillus contaminans TaxID=450362 RepID=A0A329MIT2_9BACL|nr:Gfo/Idh/MocA family oxidoreductase [Paenibacillus contaminans]RAV19266.1 gfo/Idh/MocA family oxidoreductase [Paenibacillus contaminans]